MKFELRQMRKQGSGAIVNCSSIGGLVGTPGRGAYHAAKHGVIGLTRSAALEYAAKGIRINAVCPGVIHTPMVDQMMAAGQTDALNAMLKDVPIGRLGRPEEIADAVLWLCSPAASLVVGHSLVDGFPSDAGNRVERLAYEVTHAVVDLHLRVRYFRSWSARFVNSCGRFRRVDELRQFTTRSAACWRCFNLDRVWTRQNS